MITVDDPQKVGDPIRSFTMYTVHTRVTLSLFNIIQPLKHLNELTDHFSSIPKIRIFRPTTLF